jgi:hypothetical protein
MQVSIEKGMIENENRVKKKKSQKKSQLNFCFFTCFRTNVWKIFR